MKCNALANEIIRARTVDDGFLVKGQTYFQSEVEYDGEKLKGGFEFTPDFYIEWDILFDETFKAVDIKKFVVQRGSIFEYQSTRKFKSFLVASLEEFAKSKRLPIILGEYPELTSEEKMQQETNGIIAELLVGGVDFIGKGYSKFSGLLNEEDDKDGKN